MSKRIIVHPNLKVLRRAFPEALPMGVWDVSLMTDKAKEIICTDERGDLLYRALLKTRLWEQPTWTVATPSLWCLPSDMYEHALYIRTVANSESLREIRLSCDIPFVYPRRGIEQVVLIRVHHTDPWTVLKQCGKSWMPWTP